MILLQRDSMVDKVIFSSFMKVKSHQLIHMKEGWGINIVTINVSFSIYM